jgi:DNA-binding response OmpR family regulator
MRILIVEDDTNMQGALASTLKSACFVVDTASDGEQGSYLARTNEYDLAIFDYMLPKKDGCQLCTEIRSAGKGFPILMLSVKDHSHEKALLLNHGADDYLAKPFSIDEFMARVRALLRRPKLLQSPIINIGRLTIDSDRQFVRCGSKMIYLTRKEFSLLEYLAKHKDMVVSRGMIMEHVWDIGSDPFSNTIEAHIVNLRKKLGQQRKLISTVPGRGYRLSEKV